MQEQPTQQDKLPDQLTDILLVLDTQKKKIEAVKGIDKKGNLETVTPDKEHSSQFMKVDKHGDIFSNFFSNFLRQLKDPTRFSFFKVTATHAVETAKKMQQHVNNPTADGTALLKKHEVEQPNHSTENKNNMETTQTAPATGENRYKVEQVDWQTMSNLGLSKEKLEKMNLLNPLLKGYKTNELVPISLNLGTSVIKMDARLSLQPGENGQAVMAIHGIRKEPQLNYPFFGHEFTKEDKDNLLKSGNMGRVVDLINPKNGETIPSIISVDRLTNELVALRTEKIKIPEEIKGMKLDGQQKQSLMEGKPVYMEGMLSKKGEPFNANVQYNADKRSIEFLFDKPNGNNQTKTHQQTKPDEAPKVFRGKELDDDQYNKLNAGQTVYVNGLVDKKGKEYQGYISFDKETGKTGFSFTNPNAVKEKVQPAESNKTQVAVNSEGKTNEATSNIKEPLKAGQKEPDSKKQQQEQKPKAPAKSKAHKI